jgi:hypothetical protein
MQNRAAEAPVNRLAYPERQEKYNACLNWIGLPSDRMRSLP